MVFQVNKFKINLVCILIISFFICSAYSQEVSEKDKNESPFSLSQIEDIPVFGKHFVVAPTFKDFIHQMDFVMDFAPTLYLNTASTLISAPSPIFFPLTIGFSWPKDCFISLNPKITFYSMYYLWYFNSALPSEIENRTVTSLSFLVNIPISFSIYLRRSYFQFSLGMGFLFRFGFLSNAVTALDSGYFGSAEIDANFIKDWFWQNGRYLYISTEISWLFKFTNVIKAGPTVNLYLPFGGIINDGNFNGLMCSVGMKFVL